MKKRLEYFPFIAATAFLVLGKIFKFETAPLKATTLILSVFAVGALIYLRRFSPPSAILKGMVAYLVLTALAFWVWPDTAGKLMAAYPTAALYGILFLIAAVPPLMGREVFTMHFARKTTPEAVWQTDIFKTINYHLNGLWAALFFCSFASALLPGIAGFKSPVFKIIFEVLLPVALMLGIGLAVTRRYPDYYQRKLGLTPVGMAESGRRKDTNARRPAGDLNFIAHQSIPHKKMEEPKMPENPTIVAVNGSPHAGRGNTCMMIEMLRGPLSDEGFNLEVIHLCEKQIDYCYGCGFCIEKGKCWIEDDHRAIVNKLLAAAGIILGSPVYVAHVTGQMKTFLDRSLAYGHKPRPTWKPGLAVCVSAGLGETQTADYLAWVLRIYGAFGVGKLTALATAPGEFVGKEAVEARAQDLARDLARAIKEKRRWPASDIDLRFYQFMGDLVKNNKDTIMKHDFKHWQAHGFYDGFETYIQQTTHRPQYNPEAREASIKDLIARHKKKKRDKQRGDHPTPSGSGPLAAKTCRELLQMMPLGFNASEANGLEAVYQFEISGDENFTAYLKISRGQCVYHDGPAPSPGVIIKTPAAVWLAIARGELDGQQAFMSEKYTVAGDLSLLMRLKSLFSG
jgi:multimeric flavodoxin WrbA/putative sterol carrier protein